MFKKTIEITTTKNMYTIELFNSENKSNKTNVKIYFNDSLYLLTLKTEFKATFKTAKKLINNYIKTELNGEIIAVTEY